ncbi:hypothetical protein BC835DRAFT_1412862 [Cytidiella melzeri]|nr:hypothetical protein BC835DRAFT_1412862 [Cytidiella melzeri]
MPELRAAPTLSNPIDGGVNPAQHYFSIGEMNTMLEAYGQPLLCSPSPEPEPQAGPQRPASVERLNWATWKDNGANPPQSYDSVAEINATREAYGQLPIGHAFAPPPPQLDQEHSNDATHVQHNPAIGDAPPGVAVAVPAVLADAEIAQELSATTSTDKGSKILTNVGITRSVLAAKQTVRGKATSTKEEKNKAREICYSNRLTLSDFIKSTLAVHGLQDIYVISVGSGPAFKMW